MIGNIYQRGLNRIKVLSRNKDKSLNIIEWTILGQSEYKKITEKEIKQLKQII